MSRMATVPLLLAAAADALVTSARGANDGNSTSTLNVCIHEHLAPEFFLLGVPKGGTTRFYEDFVQSPGIVKYKPGDSEPEWHEKEPWVFADGFDMSYTDTWLSHYPECDQDRRLVAVDCTPGYFGNRGAAYGLASVYQTHEIQNRLKFMVLLRNPVSRMHSHFYHYVENGILDDAIPDCPLTKFPTTFYEVAQNMLRRGTVCDCPCDNIMFDSRYVDSFKRYLAYFDSSQFHVIPFTKVVDPRAVEYTWDMLGVPHGTHSANYLAQSQRVEGDMDKHPDIFSEVDEATLMELELYMDRVAGASELAAFFASSHINLFNYTGLASDGYAIERWLRAGWGS